MPEQLDKLLTILRAKKSLNAEFSCRELDDFFVLGRTVGASGFAAVAAEVAILIDDFRNSPQQHFGKEIMTEYYHALSNCAKQLGGNGEIFQLPETSEKPKESFSSALVFPMTHMYSSVDRCKILNRSDIPQTLTRAADAFRRRIDLVDTILEVCFQLLQEMSRDEFQNWIAEYLTSHDGDLEPELIRDLLRVLLKADFVSEPLLRWTQRWSSDEMVLEQWPSVVALADMILCREALRKWQFSSVKRNGLLTHLALIVQQKNFSEDALVGWMSHAMEEFGIGVHQTLTLHLDDVKDDTDAMEWRRVVIRTELQRLADLYRPIMIICGQMMTRPDGANRMAMACLGMVGESLEAWETQVQKLAEKAVLRLFLNDLKAGRKPVETMRRLTFGDQTAFNMVCSELDLVSQSFDSVEQRNKVIKKLSYFYGSFRRQQLLGQEISRRYRALMRICHEDFLKQILTEEDWKSISDNGILHDLSGLATSARRFLDRRRALNMSVEEMMASEIDFIQDVRTRRMRILRELIF